MRSAALAAAHESGRWPLDYEGAVAVEVHVYWPDARRRDADNVVKSVLDGIQARPTRSAAWRREGGVILDDAQVRDLRVTTAIDRERPRVEVVVRAIGEGPERVTRL